MTKRLLRLLTVFLFPAVALAEPCEVASAPARLSADPSAILSLWEFDESPVLWSKSEPQSPRLEAYRQSMREFIGDVDPIHLLERQRAVFAKVGLTTELPVYDAAVRGEFGRIDRSSCLELLLLARHLSDVPNRSGMPTEFAAFVLRKKQGVGRVARLKVYMASTVDPFVTGDAWSHLLERVRLEVREGGWSVLTQIHNHPFLRDGLYGDVAGTTIPGSADREVFRELLREFGLPSAFITNAFDSIRLESADFERFP